jgi:peptide methionine sulfoxide reductase msrA/msrB
MKKLCLAFTTVGCLIMGGSGLYTQETAMPNKYTKPSGSELKQKLTPLQFHVTQEVTQEAGTEPEAATKNVEVATLAGGCFWGMQELLRQQPGVISTVAGYTGGTMATPHYEDVKSGRTGHAESVEIKFDPTKTSYEDILRFFFRMHDPTTLDRQGNDVGSQYRSAIFYHSMEQKRTAEKVKAELDKSGKWKKPIVTEIVPSRPFYPAEEYHQDYLQKHPDGYTCHWVRD